MKDILRIWILANIEIITLFGVILFVIIRSCMHPEEAKDLIVLCFIAAIPGAPSKNLTETFVKIIFPLGGAFAFLYMLYDGNIISEFEMLAVILVSLILTISNCKFVYKNIDNVISRSMRYRYTNVDLMTYKFKFLLDRFLVVFSILLFSLTILLICFYYNEYKSLIESNKNETLSLL